MEIKDLAENFLPQDDVQEVEQPTESNIEPVEQEEAKEDTHGWKDFDTYVADGGDPEMYRGKKAFDQWQEFKEKKRGEGDAIKEQMRQLIEMQQAQIESAKQKAAEEARQEVLSKMNAAKENLDFDAYEAANKELQQIEQPKQQQAAPYQDVITNLKQSMPMLDQDSESFNRGFAAVFNDHVNAEFGYMGINDLSQVSKDRLEMALKRATENAKRDMPHLFKPQRKAPNTATPNAPKGNAGGLRNRLADIPGAQAMYDNLKKSVSKETADMFAKSQLGEA